MDGNQSVLKVLDKGGLPTRDFMLMEIRTSVLTPCCHRWTLDFGIPAEMTGFSLFMYNDEHWSVETRTAKTSPCQLAEN